MALAFFAISLSTLFQLTLGYDREDAKAWCHLWRQKNRPVQSIPQGKSNAS